jgi:tetratricopeptide (TPR) repeat protein
MLDEKIPSQKVLLMKDVFLNILKYLGLLTAAEYFLSDIRSKSINKLFIDKLYQPHFGNWNHFIRETLAFLESKGHVFIVSEIMSFYKKAELDSKACKYKLNTEYIDGVGDKQIIARNFTAIGGLINFRNRFIGHGTVLNQEKCEVVYNTYYPILKDLLTAMDFVPKYPLFKICHEKKIKLMGIHLNDICPNPNPVGNSVSLWIETPEGKQLSLIPFFISPELYLTDVQGDDQLFIYEQYTSKRIVYFSPKQETGETSGEPVSILNKMLKEKERMEPVELKELTEEMLEIALSEESLTTLEELLLEQKIISGIYQSREDNEQSIRSFINSPKPLYFLAAEAGSGKTNLLAEMYRQLSDHNKKALLLKAIRLTDLTLEKAFIKALNLKEDADFSSSEIFYGRQDDPLIILLDGCNEHKEPENLFASCIDLINKMPAESIKIIVSWRINSPKDYPVINREMSHLLFDAGGEGRLNVVENPLIAHAAILKPLNKKELSGAWKQYQTDQQKRFSTRFSFEDLELKDREFSKHLGNPLLLRLFMELNKGKVLPQKGKALRIWPEWYKNLENQIPGSARFMMDLIREIYEKEENVLDVDSLFDHPQLRSAIRQLNIDSPYRRLLAKGVLSQYFREGFLSLTFTVEGMYHYLLSRFLKTEIQYQSGQKLLEIIKNKRELKGIEEAVGHCLLDEVIEGNLDHLSQFIQVGTDYLQVSSVPLAAAIQFTDHNQLLDKLLLKNNKNVIEAVFLADYILERNLFNEIRYDLFKVFLSRIHIGDYPDESIAQFFHRYNLICHEYGKYEESLQYAIRFHELRKRISDKKDLELAAACNRLAVAYRKLMRNTSAANIDDYGNKALEYELEALNIREKLLEPGHLDIARSYDNLEKIHEYRGEWKEAISYGKKLIEFYRTYFDPLYPLLAGAYNNTAIVLREDMQKDQSIAFSEKALEIAGKSYGEIHLEMAYANWTLSNTYVKFGDREKALSCMNTTVSILEKLLSPDHPNMILACDTRNKLRS